MDPERSSRIETSTGTGVSVVSEVVASGVSALVQTPAVQSKVRVAVMEVMEVMDGSSLVVDGDSWPPFSVIVHRMIAW